MSARPDRTWVVLGLLGVVFLGMLGLSALDSPGDDLPEAVSSSTSPTSSPTPTPSPTPASPTPSDEPSDGPSDGPSVEPTPEPQRERATLPSGGRRVFGHNRFLVAYYGTARTGSLGVLGETDPDTMVRRLRRAAAPFERKNSKVQIVFELIVTVADAHPGKGGDFNHDIARRDVQRYIDAAHRHGALLLLDIQPGRADFFSVVRRWKWALADPYVGLALDPEWRMGPRGVPGQRVGSVGAAEVNQVSKWLQMLVNIERLPQKLFVLHQFRSDMIDNIERITRRRHLVMVQHVDGFGTPQQKLGTYRTVMRPRQFMMGFKLFYDEDHRLMRPGEVRRIRPPVRFVSYQ